MSRTILGALTALTFLAACTPNVPRVSDPADVPADWKRVGEAGWSMRVPPQWERDQGRGSFGEVIQSDAWWEWHLVVQGTCTTYIVRIVVSGESVAELQDAVDHMLASVRLADDTRAVFVGC